LNRFCSSNGSIACCEKEQTLNSKECSELTGTLTSPTKMSKDERLADVGAVGIAKADHERRYATTNMMLFNNGYDVTVIDTSTTQLTMQHPVVGSPVSDTTTSTACQDNLIILISTDIQSVVLSQSKVVKYSIYPYFSSTLEVSIAIAICLIMHTKYNRE